MQRLTHSQHAQQEQRRAISRRWFFKDCGIGLGSIALHSLLAENAPAALPDPMAPRAGHFKGKAKRVIYLFMAGAPSHLELFDNKPQLTKFDGTLPPPDLLKGYRAAFINPDATLLGPKFKYARHGKSGTELSELLPHLAGVVDDITLIKSMQTDAFNHAPAQIMMNTGSPQFGRPSFGAWTTYGLGCESQDLPAYVVFSTGNKGTSGGASNWGPGFSIGTCACCGRRCWLRSSCPWFCQSSDSRLPRSKRSTTRPGGRRCWDHGRTTTCY